jgi:hypothetical protein
LVDEPPAFFPQAVSVRRILDAQHPEISDFALCPAQDQGTAKQGQASPDPGPEDFVGQSGSR